MIKPNQNVIPLSNEIEVKEATQLDVDSARAVAQIQGAMAIAKRFPRDENKALERIATAAKRRKAAEQAEYEYSKGGASVSGPSIRAAEILSQAWGNMLSGITEVVRDTDKNESLMLAYAADLETNNWKFVEWRVHHSIDKSGGVKKAVTSGRDIYEKIMNDGSRRLRNCLLAVIPGDVTDTYIEACNKTLSKSEIPMVERLSAMCEAMKEVGVTQPMIENKMGCAYSAITERQLAQLRRIYQAIKDEFGKVSDYFKTTEKPDNAEKTEALKNALNEEPVAQPSIQTTKVVDGSDFASFSAPKIKMGRPIIEEEAQPEFDSESAEPQEGPGDLIEQVMNAAHAAGMDVAKLTKRTQKDFKKLPRELDTKELVKLLSVLKKENKNGQK